jgi:hypothetical protein
MLLVPLLMLLSPHTGLAADATLEQVTPPRRTWRASSAGRRGSSRPGYASPRSGHSNRRPTQMMKNPATSKRAPARIILGIGTRPEP